MDQKRLKKLSRQDLLRMLLQQTKISEQLKKENDELKQKLDFKEKTARTSSSLVEAELKLSGVFQSAKKVSDEVVADAEARRAETEEYCRMMIEETQKGCRALIQDARQQADETTRAKADE